MFLQRRTQATYEELLAAIVNHCQQLNLKPDPDYIITDCESSIIQEIQAVLGDAVEIAGCFYHLIQATWRKIQELGLVNHYQDDEEVDDVVEDLDELLTYFDNMYVNGIYWARQNANNIQVRVSVCVSHLIHVMLMNKN